MMFSVSTPFFKRQPVSPIPMFSVSIPLFHDVYTQNTCLHFYISWIAVSPFLYFTVYSVSTPLFHDVQCFNSYFMTTCVSWYLVSPFLYMTYPWVKIPQWDEKPKTNTETFFTEARVPIPAFHDNLVYIIISTMTCISQWQSSPLVYFTTSVFGAPFLPVSPFHNYLMTS